MGEGALFLPPPWWGREPCFSLPPGGGGSLVSPCPLVGEGALFLPPPLWGREPCFSLPPCGGGLGWGNCAKEADKLQSVRFLCRDFQAYGDRLSYLNLSSDM